MTATTQEFTPVYHSVVHAIWHHESCSVPYLSNHGNEVVPMSDKTTDIMIYEYPSPSHSESSHTAGGEVLMTDESLSQLSIIFSQSDDFEVIMTDESSPTSME